DLPKKKPLLVQDQIATDKHGRRRFHGAFTGGFSAGHFNSVGTPEGWTPSSFKSSRSSKIDDRIQRPEDFMDDEDVDDFGIAPSVLRAKSEYSGAKSAKKRERVYFQEGPIPGDPVLQKILEPAKNTVGVLLLMKMGWKPGQGIGPRISKLAKRMQKRKAKLESAATTKTKVYGCSMKPPSSSEESGESDEDLDVNLLFAPDDNEVMFSKPKSNTFGMGYSGLDRNPVLSALDPSRAIQDTFRMVDKSKKLAIRGQAFGVGAFEEEDADIYARDDMSQYDFALETPASLREKKRLERSKRSEQLAITGGEDVIEGFVPAKNPPVKAKHFPPPTLPPGYQPYHRPRKSRFGPEKSNVPEIKGKSRALDSDDRSVILGEKSSSKKQLEKPLDEENERNEPVSDIPMPELPPPDPKDDMNFRPFIGDPPKQARYEKYLQFVKIGAKDAFKSIQPKAMSEWERERERTEFEQAAKLYRPLSGMMADRFARAELPDESLDPLKPVEKMLHRVPAAMIEAAKSKMFGKLTRTIDDWAPVSLLCKRMNVAEPTNRGGVSLCEIAKEKSKSKSKFSVFDILANSDNPFKSFEKTDKPEKPESDVERQKPPAEIPVEEKTQEEPEIVEKFETIRFDDLSEKRDLFKAIFCDSEDEEEEPSQAPPKPSTAGQQNLLRNTSPPRGIFVNLNFDKLNAKKPEPQTVNVSKPSNVKPSTTNEESNKKSNDESISPPIIPASSSAVDLYGPALPEKPVFVRKPKIIEKSAAKSSSDSSASSSEDEWVEKDASRGSEKSKKKKKKEHKKDKRKKKKSKHKERKRKHKEKRR
ncbi:unnamed protein product, partial [Nesidiocoris tenuis]